MPTSYNDQFYQMNPFVPPPRGRQLEVQFLEFVDQNDDGRITQNAGDTLNGYPIEYVFAGDTVTVDLSDGTRVTYTGTTFGVDTTGSNNIRFYFSPTSVSTGDDPVFLKPGTFYRSTAVIPNGNNNNLAIAALGAPCFTRGVMILTDDGECAVEKLKVGDLVETLDHGLQPIRWIGHRYLGQRELSVSTQMKPILIARGALGVERPAQDLLVSPQHRVLVRSSIAQRMFGADEVLVAAKQLTALPGIEVQEDCDGVEYFHLMFDQHQVIRANQAWSKSLYPGPEAQKSIGAAACEELFSLFPELRYNTLPTAARTLVPGRRGRQLAARHAENQKPLAARRAG